MNPSALHQDSVFRRIVVVSTGLALSGMLGSLASIEISRNAGLRFQWHWTVALWIGAALLWNWRFWHLIWKAQGDSSPALRRKIIVSCLLLAGLGIGAFLYPIRFLADSYLPEIGRGLVTAALFLGTLGWFVLKFGQGFLEQDKIELKRQES